MLPGDNVRPQEINAAVGQGQLEKLRGFTGQRRANLKQFQEAFAGDEKFIIQRENGKSSAFCFPIIVRPGSGLERADVFGPLKDAKIGFRMVTGGCFPRHDAIKYFDYDIIGDVANAEIVHDRGFFVGNHPLDLSAQIEKLRDVLNGL